MTPLLKDLAGWVGATVLLASYGLVSFKKLGPASAWYQGLNAVASALLIVNTVFHRAYPSAVVNAIWILIAMAAQMRDTLSNDKKAVRRLW